jgi:SAM-dependent methyltransferase
VSSDYTSLEAELHDAFWADADTPELEWLDALLKDHPGLALEVGCGSGRLLGPLREKGHAIEGLESSEAMLALCRNALPGAILHQGDMATFRREPPYHSLLLPAFTLQLADDPVRALENFHRLLVSGGLLYLTVFIPFAELDGNLPEGEWYPDHETELPDGRRATLHTRYHIKPDQRILHRDHHYRLHEEDRMIEHVSKQTIRWFEPLELHRELKETGFVIENAVADFDEEIPVDDDAQIITVIARKT